MPTGDVQPPAMIFIRCLVHEYMKRVECVIHLSRDDELELLWATGDKKSQAKQTTEAGMVTPATGM